MEEANGQRGVHIFNVREREGRRVVAYWWRRGRIVNPKQGWRVFYLRMRTSLTCASHACELGPQLSRVWFYRGVCLCFSNFLSRLTLTPDNGIQGWIGEKRAVFHSKGGRKFLIWWLLERKINWHEVGNPLPNSRSHCSTKLFKVKNKRDKGVKVI